MSRPKRLASVISRISSIRLSSTSLREGTFLLLICRNLARCSISRIRDRLAVDEQHHLLRACSRGQAEHDRAGENRRGKARPMKAERNPRSHFVSLLSGLWSFALPSLFKAICARSRRLSVSSLAPPPISSLVSLVRSSAHACRYFLVSVLYFRRLKSRCHGVLLQ